MGRKYTEAQKEAHKRYVNKKPFDRINVTVPKGELAKIKEYAQKNNESVNAMVNRLIKQEMESSI